MGFPFSCSRVLFCSGSALCTLILLLIFAIGGPTGFIFGNAVMDIYHYAMLITLLIISFRIIFRRRNSYILRNSVLPRKI